MTGIERNYGSGRYMDLCHSLGDGNAESLRPVSSYLLTDWPYPVCSRRMEAAEIDRSGKPNPVGGLRRVLGGLRNL